MQQKLSNFISCNFSSIMTASAFLVMIYVQHVINTSNIIDLNDRCTAIEAKVDECYKKMDDKKLDKSVFEATMSQFILMQEDLKEIRTDIKEILKAKK